MNIQVLVISKAIMILSFFKKKAHIMLRHKDGQLPISRTIESPGVVKPWVPALKTDKVHVMTPGTKIEVATHRFATF